MTPPRAVHPPGHRVAAAALLLIAAAAGASCSAAVDPRMIEDARTVVRIRSVLVNQPDLGLRPIDIRVAGGVAHLTGRVNSEDEARRLITLVAAVPGVVDVKSDVRIEPGAPAQPPPLPDEPAAAAPQDSEAAADRRLLAIGLAISRTHPPSEALGARTSLGPIVRLGSGDGFGPVVAFNWMTTPLFDAEDAARRLGDVRLRPLMVGLGYTWAAERVSASVSAAAGYSFNSLTIGEIDPSRAVAVRVGDSLAWRPGVSIWHDATGRVAVHAFAGYFVSRPRLTLIEGNETIVRTLRADTPVLRFGLAYKLF